MSSGWPLQPFSYVAACPLSADIGCGSYSITSSACRSNGLGMLMPSALAVLRLTTISNLLA
jgi:hypothetical protein